MFLWIPRWLWKSLQRAAGNRFDLLHTLNTQLENCKHGLRRQKGGDTSSVTACPSFCSFFKPRNLFKPINQLLMTTKNKTDVIKG